MKDKFDLQEAFEKKTNNVLQTSVRNNSEAQDAIEALVALGYSSTDALKAVRSLDIDDSVSSGNIVKLALKVIGKV